MTKENIYLDLSKLTREEIIEVYELIIKNNQFIKPFFKHEYWNKLNYSKIDERWRCSGKNWDGLHSLTEVTLSEFRELFESLKSQEYGSAKITRFEFITKENGREIVRYGDFTYQIQDDGRTLKVFQES